MTKKELFGKL